MELLGQYQKAIVALVLAIVMLFEIWTGFSLSDRINEEVIVSILALLGPLAVWLVPNRT